MTGRIRSSPQTHADFVPTVAKSRVTIMSNNWDNKAFIMCALFDYLEKHSDCYYKEKKTDDCIPLYNNIVKLFMMMDNIHDFAKNARGFKETYERFSANYGLISDLQQWVQKITIIVNESTSIAEAKIRLINLQAINVYKKKLETYIAYVNDVFNIQVPSLLEQKDVNIRKMKEDSETEYKLAAEESKAANDMLVTIEKEEEKIAKSEEIVSLQQAEDKKKTATDTIATFQQSKSETEKKIKTLQNYAKKLLSNQIKTTWPDLQEIENSLTKFRNDVPKKKMSPIQDSERVEKISEVKQIIEKFKAEQKTLDVTKQNIDESINKATEAEKDVVAAKKAVTEAKNKRQNAPGFVKLPTKTQARDDLKAKNKKLFICKNKSDYYDKLYNEIDLTQSDIVKYQTVLKICNIYYNHILENNNIFLVSYLASDLDDILESENYGINKYLTDKPNINNYLLSNVTTSKDNVIKPILPIKIFTDPSDTTLTQIKYAKEIADLILHEILEKNTNTNITIKRRRELETEVKTEENSTDDKQGGKKLKITTLKELTDLLKSSEPNSSLKYTDLFNNESYTDYKPQYDFFNSYLIANIAKIKDEQKDVSIVNQSAKLIKTFSEVLKILKPKEKEKKKDPDTGKPIREPKKQIDPDMKVEDLCGNVEILKQLLVSNLNSWINSILPKGSLSFKTVFVHPYMKYIDDIHKQHYMDIINNINLQCFSTQDFGPQWEKKLLTMLCSWGRVKSVKMLKYVPNEKKMHRNPSVQEAPSTIGQKNMSLQNVTYVPTFYTYYIKELNWSHDMITSKERRIISFLNSNILLFDDNQNKSVELPSKSKTFLVTSYFDGCKGTKSGSFGSEVLRDMENFKDGFDFNLNFSDTTNGIVKYNYKPLQGCIKRQFPEEFGKGSEIVEIWSKTKSEIIQEMTENEDEKIFNEKNDTKTSEEEDEQEQDEQEEDDLILEGYNKSCKKNNTTCIWERVDDIIVQFRGQNKQILSVGSTVPSETLECSKRAITEYNSSQDNISYKLTEDEIIDVDATAAASSSVAAASSSASSGVNEHHIESSRVNDKAEYHLIDGKTGCRKALQRSDKNKQYEAENDFHIKIHNIKSEKDDSTYQQLKADYQQKIKNECTGYTSTEFVNAIGFFTTMKCIGDFSQCVEAYKRDCLFMAADAMQFILGCTIGTKMLKNHGWDFINTIGKHYWISDSLFNYIYNKFKYNSKFFNDENNSRMYKFLDDTINKDQLLEKFIVMLTSRNTNLCDSPQVPTKKIYNNIYNWFSVNHSDEFKIIAQDTDISDHQKISDNEIIFGYNSYNIIYLLDFEQQNQQATNP
jgi:hypothetical protein